MGIDVEIPIRASLDELWEKTQNPHLHQRWDLRFSHIEYLPRDGDEPQKFLYRTRIGFGLKIDGQGESTGTRDGDKGERTSSLKFWSGDSKSLIKSGSGYWKYVPNGSAIRFLTWYDYEPRFGAVGKLIDPYSAGRRRGVSTGSGFGLRTALFRRLPAIVRSPTLSLGERPRLFGSITGWFPSCSTTIARSWTC